MLQPRSPAKQSINVACREPVRFTSHLRLQALWRLCYYILIPPGCYHVQGPLEVPLWIFQSGTLLVRLYIGVNELDETIQILDRDLLDIRASPKK